MKLSNGQIIWFTLYKGSSREMANDLLERLNFRRDNGISISSDGEHKAVITLLHVVCETVSNDSPRRYEYKVKVKGLVNNNYESLDNYLTFTIGYEKKKVEEKIKIKLIKDKMPLLADLYYCGINFDLEYEVLVLDDHGVVELKTFDKYGIEKVFHFYKDEYIIKEIRECFECLNCTSDAFQRRKCTKYNRYINTKQPVYYTFEKGPCFKPQGPEDSILKQTFTEMLSFVMANGPIVRCEMITTTGTLQLEVETDYNGNKTIRRRER